MCFIHLGRSLGGVPAHSIPRTFGEDLDIVPALQQQGFGIWVMGFRRLAGPEWEGEAVHRYDVGGSISEMRCTKEPLHGIITELSA